MKPLLALLCAVAIGYVAYEFVYPPFGRYFGIDHPPAPPPPPEKQPEVVINMPKVEIKPEPKPEPKMEEPKPEPKPVMAEAPPAPPPVVEPPKPKEGEFVPPTFKPLEEITQNWTVLPAKVFPRPIKISKDVQVKSAIGATQLKAGGNAYAIGQEGADLIVSPSPDGKFKGKLAIADTDIKDIVIAVYEAYKVNETNRQKTLFEMKKQQALNPKASVAAGGKGGADDKPVKDKDGSYPILVASMKSGEVTEIKPDNVKKWGEVTREKDKDHDFWSVVVTFEATTPFGKFEQDAQAQIKNGKVQKWIYTGSGEVVP